MKNKLVIKQDEEQPIAVEVMAASIVEIASFMKKVNKSPLKREAIVALIKDKSGLNKSTIEIVLNNLEDLEHSWCKPKNKK